jgi:hypothetical protein
MEEEVLDFISTIKEKYPLEIEDTFSNGLCYWFAKILQIRFGGDIYFDPYHVHFAIIIDNNMYDITGKIERCTSDWFNWEDYKLYNDTTAIEKSCIIKANNRSV